MATQAEASHNSRRRSSEKNARFSTPRSATRHLPLAAEVARKLGIVATWPNVQTIRLAIESEVVSRDANAQEVAEMLVQAANEFTNWKQYSISIRGRVARTNFVDRFWFEDARWKDKQAYYDFCMGLQEARNCEVIPGPPKCWKCEDTGQVWNYGPGDRKLSCPDCQGKDAA